MSDLSRGPIGLLAQTACIWEVTARKAGNVHRHCDFADVNLVDFLLSAAAIAPILESTRPRPVGETVLEGVRATRRVTSTNTNLGILLLLAPLARVPLAGDLESGVEDVLDHLTLADTQAVFEAIRLAQPGGLGQVGEQDVRSQPSRSLRDVMALAAERDLIARQYANGFHEVLGEGVPILAQAWQNGHSLEEIIISTHLYLLANHPDSLIARKQGLAEAEEARQRASFVQSKGGPFTPTGRLALAEFDTWLRAEGHRRNPGTTADLVTACLFVALREGIIPLPCPRHWTG